MGCRGLIIHASNRLERLADELARLLREPLPSLLQPETVVVQSRGMQRWLSLELARRNGICANVRFPFPTTALDELASGRTDTGGGAANSGFEPVWLTLRVAALLPELARAPGFEELDTYRQGDDDGLKTLQLAERIAECFDRYQVFRPEMVLGWEAGSSGGWQAELWRRLAPDGGRSHRARACRDLIRALRRPPSPSAGWPTRISLFGISYLPPLYFEVFTALARHTAVHLFLLSPSREFWGEILNRRELGRLRTAVAGDAPSDAWLHLDQGHRLLASLGEQGRDFFRLVSAGDAQWQEHYADPGEANLLCCLQSDMLALRQRRPGDGPLAFDPLEDRSIQVHACHSPLREVEVLHQQLLALFESCPGLSAGDVLVMVPDVGRYAPLVAAVFDAPESEALRIPYTLADRGWAAQSPALEGFFALLQLPEGRLEASAVLDLLAVSAVQRRLGLAPDSVPRLRQWVLEAGIRWGLDGASKTRLGLPAFDQNTWRAGIDRLLLGVALPATGLFAGILPSDAVSGSQTQELGTWLDFLEGLFAAVERLSTRRSLSEWAALLRQLLDDFFAATDDEDRLALEALRASLTEMEQLAQQAAMRYPLHLPAVRYWLQRRMQQGEPGGGFLSGGVTVCAMVPMRCVPADVICLLGMDDALFPRQQLQPTFDYMLREPRLGDRSRRRDDKYLFLEALLAARRVFYLSYVGQSAQDNAPLPPSVLVSELLDTLTAGFDDGRGLLRARLETRHPLHSFSPRQFSGEGRARGFSVEDFDAAQASLEAAQPRVFLSTPLQTASEPEEVDVEALQRFLVNPARALLQHRLGLRYALPAELPDDRENLTLNALERFDLNRWLLEELSRQRDVQELCAAIRAEGRLPPGSVGDAALEQIQAQAAVMLARMRRCGGQLAAVEQEIRVELQGQALVGRVMRWPPSGAMRAHAGRLRATDLLAVWVQHLALQAVSDDGQAPVSHLLARDEGRSFGPVPHWRRVLETLLACYRLGMRQPWPFFAQAGLVYAEQRLVKHKSERAALGAALRCWQNDGTFGPAGEAMDPYVRRLFGHGDPLGEEFARSAELVFGPLLAVMTTEAAS